MKFSGEVGFWDEDEETVPGVWKPNIVEKHYSGDVLQNSRKFQSDSSQNDSFVVNNQISILADLYARENWPSIRYVIWKGTKWKVTSVKENYPRLILEIGGVYNGAGVGEQT